MTGLVVLGCLGLLGWLIGLGAVYVLVVRARRSAWAAMMKRNGWRRVGRVDGRDRWVRGVRK